MLIPTVAATARVSALALISLGGGLYGCRAVDRAWPRRPDLIQPARGGVSAGPFGYRRTSRSSWRWSWPLVVTWPEPEIRSWLLVALASHATMRIWSGFAFIPKALAFERADPVTVAEAAARASGRGAASGACRWTP